MWKPEFHPRMKLDNATNRLAPTCTAVFTAYSLPGCVTNMHPIYSAYSYFLNLYKSPLLMEENKICKCCCSESRGGWVGGPVCLMLDGKGGRQSNQSVCILANTFRTIHKKDKLFENLVIPCWCDSDKVDWKPMELLTNVQLWQHLPPDLKATLQVPNKMSALLCTTDRTASQFQLAVFKSSRIHGEALEYVLRWSERELTFAWFPRRGETLSITVLIPPRFRRSSVWVSWCHMSRVWERARECTNGKRGWEGGLPSTSCRC